MNMNGISNSSELGDRAYHVNKNGKIHIAFKLYFNNVWWCPKKTEASTAQKHNQMTFSSSYIIIQPHSTPVYVLI